MPRNVSVLRHSRTYLDSETDEDKEHKTIVLEVIDSGSYNFSPGTFLIGKIAGRLYPERLMACIIGNDVFVGKAGHINNRSFRIADQTFEFAEIDYLALVYIPAGIQPYPR